MTRVTDERKMLQRILAWAEQRCPCENEQPNPCPLCDADATKPGDICLSAERTIPRQLLKDLRIALSLHSSPADEGAAT